MLRSIPLRLKLLTALVLPMIVVGGYLFVDITQSLDHRSVAAAQRGEVDAHQAVSDYASAISAEHLTMSRPDADVARLETARADTDAAHQALRASELDLSAERLVALDTHQEQLVEIRTTLGPDPADAWDEVNGERAAGEATTGEHSTAMAELAELPLAVLATFEFDPDAIDDVVTASLVDDDFLVQRARADLQREASVLLWAAALPDELVDDEVVALTAAAAAETDQSMEVLAQLGSTELSAAAVRLVDSPEWADFVEFRGVATDATADVDEAALLAAASRVDTELRHQSATIVSELEQRAITSEYEARRDVVISGLIGLWLVVCVGLLLRVLYRAIKEPLERLTDQAGHVAHVELPTVIEKMRSGEIEDVPDIERIPAESKDEIGSLVMAFNDMHRSAVELAASQAESRRTVAEMFINLGRRNQRLVGRLLNGLSSLELDEQDPDTLAALYELDHTATRMRRNAESLLVLAGAPQARRFDQPVAVHDVAQASISEVENYQRVSINVNGDDLLDGGAVSDVTHLLAELVENALTFSPPDSVVEIVAGRTASGYVVAVTDNGIGMLPEQFDDVNCRIAGAADQDETPSDFLGHYVVGRLAARHGITVVLAEGPAGGVTARIWLPAAVMVGDDVPEEAVPEEPGVLPSPSAPSAAADDLAGVMPPPVDASIAPLPGTGPLETSLDDHPTGALSPSTGATDFLNALESEGVQQRSATFADEPTAPTAMTAMTIEPPAEPVEPPSWPTSPPGLDLDAPAVTPLPAWTPLSSHAPTPPPIAPPAPAPTTSEPAAQADAGPSPFGATRRTPGANLPRTDLLAAGPVVPDATGAPPAEPETTSAPPTPEPATPADAEHGPTETEHASATGVAAPDDVSTATTTDDPDAVRLALSSFQQGVARADREGVAP